jgi:exodeoxyribonuclease VII small subunit
VLRIGVAALAKKSPNSKTAEKPSFEQSLDRLEQLVPELEEGEIGLAESLVKYESGVKLLRRCYDSLQKAERRIELLSGVDADGNPVSTPWDDTSLSLEEKSQSRGQRRTAAPPRPPKSSDLDDNDMDRSGQLF